MDFVVRDYIESAVPVSSGRINEQEVLDASPATIRAIMLALDEEGYLTQPYTSAGRVPTKKGYRYFVDNLMDTEQPATRVRREIDTLVAASKETETLLDRVAYLLAQNSQVYSAAGILDSYEHFFSQGLAEVFQNPEFSEQSLVEQFAREVEHAQREMAVLLRQNQEYRNPHIAIGTFGIISASFTNKEGARCVVYSMGPQRMDYEKVNSFLKYAVDNLIGISPRRKKL